MQSRIAVSPALSPLCRLEHKFTLVFSYIVIGFYHYCYRHLFQSFHFLEFFVIKEILKVENCAKILQKQSYPALWPTPHSADQQSIKELLVNLNYELFNSCFTFFIPQLNPKSSHKMHNTYVATQEDHR